MEPYMSEDYLKLFQNIQNSPNESYIKPKKEELKPINEGGGRYDNLQNINEVNNVQQYQINENVNDGWNNQFEIETRVNGVVQRNNSDPYNQQMKRKNIVSNNGLEKYLVGDEDDMRETYRPQVIIQQDIIQNTPTKNLNDVEVVSLEMFERMSQMALTPLKSKIDRIDSSRVNDVGGSSVNEINKIYS